MTYCAVPYRSCTCLTSNYMAAGQEDGVDHLAVTQVTRLYLALASIGLMRVTKTGIM